MQRVMHQFRDKDQPQRKQPLDSIMEFKSFCIIQIALLLNTLTITYYRISLSLAFAKESLKDH